MSIPDYVVSIYNNNIFLGTGILVTTKGHVVTCRHVTSGQSDLRVKLGRLEPWRYKTFDNFQNIDDLELLVPVVPISTNTPSAPLLFEIGDAIKVGSEVHLWGYSTNAYYETPAFSKCAIKGFDNKNGMIGLDGNVNKGDSGGPVVSLDGWVIGIVRLRDRNRPGHGMAIPLSILKSILPEEVNILIDKSIQDLYFQKNRELDIIEELKKSLKERDEIISNKDLVILSQSETIQSLTFSINVPSAHPLIELNSIEVDKRWEIKIDVATQLLKINQPKAAQEVLYELRVSEEWQKASTDIQARVASIAAEAANLMGNFSLMASEVNTALSLFPDNLAFLSNAAGAALMSEQYDKAVTYAERVVEGEHSVEKTSASINAAAVLVQAWFSLGAYRSIETFVKSNTWLLDSSDGCSAVARVRSLQNRFDESIALTKKALKLDRNSIEALECLYDALFFPIQRQVLQGELWNYSHAIKRQMRRAEAAINRALRLLQQSENHPRKQRALINRAAVRSAQGKIDGAIADYDNVLNDTPSEVEWDSATLGKAFVLIHDNRAEESIPLLESLKSDGRKKEATFALAFSYKKNGQLDEATTILRQAWESDELSTASSWLTAETLLWLYMRLGQPDAATAVVERARKIRPEDPRSQELAAQLEFEKGNVDSSLSLLKNTIEKAASSGDFSAKMQMSIRFGDLAYRSHRFKEAAKAWRDVGWKNLPSTYQSSYVNALYRADLLGDALNTAEAMRAATGISPRVAEIEASIRAYRGEWETAREIWEQLAIIEPSNLNHCLNLAYMFIQEGSLETAKILLSDIDYELVKDNPSLLRRIASLQGETGMVEAIKYAFRCRQIDYGNPESHNDYVAIFLKVAPSPEVIVDTNASALSASQKLDLNEALPGTVPCTLRLTHPGEEGRWKKAFTVLNDGPFDRVHGFYPSSDEIVQRLLKLEVGDICSISQGLGDAIEYQLQEIVHPYVHAFQESALETSNLFPGEAKIWSFSINDGMDGIVEWAKANADQFQATFQLYVDWNLPLAAVCSIGNRSIFEIWLVASQKKDVGIHASRGVWTSFESQIQKIRRILSHSTRPSICLDITALITLVQVNVAILLSRHIDFIVPQSLERDIKSQLDKSSSGSLPDTSLAVLLQIKDFIATHCRILPPLAVVEFPVDKVDYWHSVFGQPSFDSMLIAYEKRCFLHADDALLGEVFDDICGIDTISTQSLILALRQEDKLSDEEYFTILDKMLYFGIRNIIMPDKFLFWIFENNNFKISDSLERAVSYLEGPTCDSISARNMCSYLICRVWSSPADFDSKAKVLDICLFALATGRPTRSTLVSFCRELLSRASTYNIPAPDINSVISSVAIWFTKYFS